VTGTVRVSDRSSFYYLSYNFTAFEDERALLLTSLGIYGIDLKAEFSAEGEITEGGIPVESGRFNQSINQFVPVPLLGLMARFAMTPRWSIQTAASIIGGSFGDIGALVFESKIEVEYALNPNLGISCGLGSVNADVSMDKSRQRTDVRYGFESVFLGVDGGF